MKDYRIENLGLSVRSVNALTKAGFSCLNDIRYLSQEELYAIPNMGKKSVNEIIDIQNKVLTFGESIFDNEELTVKEEKRPIREEALLIESVFPNLDAKAFSTLSFLDHNGIYCYDIQLEDLHFSVRTANALKTASINSIRMVALMKGKDLVSIKNLGKKSIDEINQFLQERTTYDESNGVMDTTVPVEDIFYIFKELYMSGEDSYNTVEFKTAFYQSIYENRALFAGKTLEDIFDWSTNKNNIEPVFTSQFVYDCLKKEVLQRITDHKEGFSMEQIDDFVPDIFIEFSILPTIIDELLFENQIEKENGKFIKSYPTIDEWLATLNERQSDIIRGRLNGLSLEEISHGMNLTRERVRQIQEKARAKFGQLKVDKYFRYYNKYDLNKEQAMYVFGIDERTFNYLKTFRDTEKRFPFEDMAENDELPYEIKNRVNSYLIKDMPIICGSRTLRRRDAVMKTIMKNKVSEQPLEIEEIQRIYMNEITQAGLAENESFLFPNIRAMGARLADANYCLSSFGKRYRYYPIDEYDAKDFVEELNLKQFHNVEISARLLLANNQELMELYGILDEYELHNYLNKTRSQWDDGTYDVSLERMPTMVFGKADVSKQVYNLLCRLSPISMKDFALEYEREYGVLSSTATNLLKYIKPYYINGIYSVSQELLDDQTMNKLKTVLTKDFYFDEDIRDVIRENLGDAIVEKLNPRIIYESGYLSYSSYYVSKRFNGASEYFTSLLSGGMVDINKMDSRIFKLSTFSNLYYQLKQTNDLLEYAINKCISYEKVHMLAPFVTKEFLDQYVDQALELVENEEFFTFKTIKNHNLETQLRELGFDDIFEENLIKNSRKLKYIGTNGRVVFYHGKENRTLVDFIKFLLKDARKMDVYDLLDVLANDYEVMIKKDKLIWITSSSDLHYEPTMNKIYLSINDMYEELEEY